VPAAARFPGVPDQASAAALAAEQAGARPLLAQAGFSPHSWQPSSPLCSAPWLPCSRPSEDLPGAKQQRALVRGGRPVCWHWEVGYTVRPRDSPASPQNRRALRVSRSLQSAAVRGWRTPTACGCPELPVPAALGLLSVPIAGDARSIASFLGTDWSSDHHRSSRSPGVRTATLSRSRLHLDTWLVGVRSRRLLLGGRDVGTGA